LMISAPVPRLVINTGCEALTTLTGGLGTSGLLGSARAPDR
jgi:hypothetical protein